uniref:CCHC-type domain-containing protein n=1 Tax=Tanacetum cinerariifolium TaxID=118510 RepID=A0A6L2NMN9_TANCI|nr:hypothetical protein [Tanacetum cinerariifolium]
MAQQSCSYCGGPFNGRNFPSCSIVGAGNEFGHDPNPLPYDNTPDSYDQPPQHHVETYSCELCGNDSHYGYDCPPRTILEKKSDEVIKSSVEDLVPIPSESEDASRSDSECDLTSCDDFSPINVPEGKSVTFSNPLFDSNDKFTSSDDESLSDEDVSKDNIKIYSNPLFEFNDEYISSDVNPLFDEDEFFDTGGDVDEINAFDIPLDFKNGYYESKGDVLNLESLLSDDTTPNLPLEDFLGYEDSRARGCPSFT